LGKRIAATATYISDQLTPQSVSDPYVTLVHGDFKSMNVFLSKDGTKPAVMVDYASTGTGIGMSDVAMHIHHAVLPEHLAGGGEEELLRHYWNTVNERLASVGKVYPWEVAESHYHLAVADYFRFFLGRFWNTTTVASMEKNADSKNTCLLNRHVDAAMAFVRRVDAYLIEIEKEFSTQE
jgi:hypothetical protein